MVNVPRGSVDKLVLAEGDYKLITNIKINTHNYDRYIHKTKNEKSYERRHQNGEFIVPFFTRFTERLK